MTHTAESQIADLAARAGLHVVDAPFYLVAYLTHTDHQIETLSAHFHERADAATVARLLRAAGWEVTIRGWRSDQRIDGFDEEGEPIWGAGYVEVQE